MRIARFVTMRRKGHNGISFLAGHFGEPRRKLRLTTKLLSQCPSTASFSLYVLGRRINAVQFAETRTISILNYDYAILDGCHLSEDQDRVRYLTTYVFFHLSTSYTSESTDFLPSLIPTSGANTRKIRLIRE